jgi:two-component system OmpR family sensor kinase
MRSLRARLVAAVLAIAAVGLLLLAGITYASQRSFLMDRVDDQAREGVFAIRGLLDGGGPGHGRPGRGPDRGKGPPGPGGGLPLGTYGQLRTADGRVLVGGFLGKDVLDSGDLTAPRLPGALPLNRLTTVDGGTGRYRVYATSTAGGSAVTVVAVPLDEVDENLDRLLLVEGLVIVAVLLALAGAAWVVVRIGLLPLDRMSHVAGRIAGGDLAHRVTPAEPRTEVGRLGLALNAMLDRLEEAFRRRQASEDRLRQFLADASHELRTPLTAIRGYAELHRLGVTRDADEVGRSMQRIEDEAARMGVLVEDLLTLARLDEVADAPHADVDVAVLARDAADDARAMAPDREVTLSVDGRAVVRGDAHQLRQLLANLLRNAVVHTPAGTPVDVEAVREGDDVRLAVRDHGPGLPTEDRDALFERFWRAEGGRERGRSGAGLGLAIVAAIVGAHHGTVRADDAPGGGAVFTVRLPAA